MEKRNRTQLVLGVLLILVAAWLIAGHFAPSLTRILRFSPFEWPMWVVFAGVLLLVIGLLVGAPGMAIPACIVAGVGGILYYQNATGHWESWAYLWTLIPGFVGVGTILAGILGEGDFKHSMRHGLNSLMVSLVLFAIFSTFFGGWNIFGPYAGYAPIVLLFALGLWLILRSLLRRK